MDKISDIDEYSNRLKWCTWSGVTQCVEVGIYREIIKINGQEVLSEEMTFYLASKW